MDASQLKYILQELRFAADMPPEIVRQLAEHSTIQDVAAGTIIFREGTNDASLYLVRSGRLALEMNVPGRGPVRILTVGPGEMVGWSSLLDQGKMTASALAVDNSQLIVAPAGKLRELCQSNHEFGFHLLQQMANALANRLVATRLQLLDLFAEGPQARPVHEPDPS